MNLERQPKNKLKKNTNPKLRNGVEEEDEESRKGRRESTFVMGRSLCFLQGGEEGKRREKGEKRMK